MRTGRNKFLGSLGVAIVIALFFVALLKIFPGVFHRIGSPTWKIENYISNAVSNTGVFFRSKNALQSENNELKKRVRELENSNALVNVFRERVEELEKLLSIKRKYSSIARVLAGPPQSPYDTLIVDKGQNSAVEKGDLVFTEGNYILGIISSVYSDTSKVKLFSTSGNNLTVDISSGQSFEAEGIGGGNFLIKMPKNIEVSESDAVFYPGSNVNIVGFIENVESKAKDPFKSIYIKSPINIHELKWVEIVK